MEALRLARHKQFGASSEKSEDSLTEQLSFLFNEAEAFSEEKKAEAENITVVAAHKRHKKHEYTLDNIPENIPVEQTEHRLEGEDLVCPECGDTMTEIGKEVVRTLEIIPAHTIVHEDVYYTYACKSCNESSDEGCETPIAKAPREKNIIPGSFATPEAIAHIMTQKLVMGSPLYRQEQETNRNDAEDGSLVHYKNVVGSPVFTIPKLGYVAEYIQNPPGTYIAISAGAILLLLVFLPDLFSDEETDKKEPKQKKKRGKYETSRNT